MQLNIYYILISLKLAHDDLKANEKGSGKYIKSIKKYKYKKI